MSEIVQPDATEAGELYLALEPVAEKGRMERFATCAAEDEPAATRKVRRTCAPATRRHRTLMLT